MSYVLKTAVLVVARRVTSDFRVNDQSSFRLRVTILRQRHRRQPRRRSIVDSLTVQTSTRNSISSTVLRHQLRRVQQFLNPYVTRSGRAVKPLARYND